MRTDPAWASVYRSMDVIQPWTVGRYSTMADVGQLADELIVPPTCRHRQQQILPDVHAKYFFWVLWTSLNCGALAEL